MKRFMARFESHSVRLLAVTFEADKAIAVMTRFNAELGEIEEGTSQMEQSKDESESMLAEAIQHGFHEIDEPAYAQAMSETKSRLEREFEEKESSEFRLIDWSEIPRFIQPRFLNDPGSLLSDRMRKFRVYPERAHVDGRLKICFDSLGPGLQTGSRNLIFQKGLTIDGDLDAGSMCEELPQFAHVEGDLRVRNLILSGWVELVVTGDVVVSGDVLGIDGESGGRLQVIGALKANSILGGSMFSIQIGGRVDARVHWIDDDSPTLATHSIVPYSIKSVDWPRREALTAISDSAYHEETDWSNGTSSRIYGFNPEFAIATLREGRPLFRG